MSSFYGKAKDCVERHEGDILQCQEVLKKLFAIFGEVTETIPIQTHAGALEWIKSDDSIYWTCHKYYLGKSPSLNPCEEVDENLVLRAIKGLDDILRRKVYIDLIGNSEAILVKNSSLVRQFHLKAVSYLDDLLKSECVFSYAPPFIWDRCGAFTGIMKLLWRSKELRTRLLEYKATSELSPNYKVLEYMHTWYDGENPTPSSGEGNLSSTTFNSYLLPSLDLFAHLNHSTIMKEFEVLQLKLALHSYILPWDTNVISQIKANFKKETVDFANRLFPIVFEYVHGRTIDGNFSSLRDVEKNHLVWRTVHALCSTGTPLLVELFIHFLQNHGYRIDSSLLIRATEVWRISKTNVIYEKIYKDIFKDDTIEQLP